MSIPSNSSHHSPEPLANFTKLACLGVVVSPYIKVANKQFKNLPLLSIGVFGAALATDYAWDRWKNREPSKDAVGLEFLVSKGLD